MNRGSPDSVAGLHRQTTRFNEAPIHESGKYRSRDREGVNAAGFNEAPIHESGK